MAAALQNTSSRTESVTLPISGMSCAACAARIEKSLSRAEGVEVATVNFATENATVTYDPARMSRDALCEAIRDIGYDVPESAPVAVGEPEQDWEQRARETELWTIRRRLAAAVLFGLPVAVLGM